MDTPETPYIKRSWFYRRLAFLRQGWRVRKNPDGEGVFFSDQVLPGTPEWDEKGHGAQGSLEHAHFSFLSHTYADRGWWYGATVLTVEQAAMEMLEDKVEATLEKFFKERGVSWDEAFGRSAGGGATFKPKPLPSLAGDDGRPRTGWECYGDAWGTITASDWEALALKVGSKRDVTLPRYVGLRAVVDREGVDKEFLVSFVKAFWSSGEVEFGRPVDWAVHGPRMEKKVTDLISFYGDLVDQVKKESSPPKA